MTDFFNEVRMLQFLSRCLPDGETIIAGIHGLGLEMEIKQIFVKCILEEDVVVPDENGTVLLVDKSKYAKHDVYIGISQNYLLLAECEDFRHLYEVTDLVELGDETFDQLIARAAQEPLQTPVSLEEMGRCFPLSAISDCAIEKAWMGAIKCTIAMDDGSRLKILLPKLGGLGKGMPHHKEYRDAIIACLEKYHKE